MNFQLYDWQNRCQDAWFTNHCRGIANVITGAGKTVLALAAMKKLDENSAAPLKVKIIVPKTFMVSQWISSILSLYEYLEIEREEIGCYCGSIKDTPDKKYMIYVINSARYNLSRHIIDNMNHGDSILLIADECHHYGGEENRKIFDFIDFFEKKKVDLSNRYYSLGLSATPQSPYFESILVPALGREFFKYGLSEALRCNTINPFTLFHAALTFTPDEQAEYDEVNEQLIFIMRQITALFPYLRNLDKTVYFQVLQQMAQDKASAKASSLASALLKLMHERKRLISNSHSRIDCACQLIKRLDNRSKIIIFSEQIEQTDQLFNQLQALYPHQVGRYHSAMDAPARKRILQQYHDGELRILVSCKALDEGLNVPAANIGIVLSSTRNQRQRLQRLGRVLRKTDTVKNVCLYYLYISSSIEDQGYLDAVPDITPVLEISYSSELHCFIHQQYDRLASCYYREFKKLHKNPAVLDELRICIAQGQIRSDWLLNEEECILNLQNAESVHEANYWFCMKEIAKLRK